MDEGQGSVEHADHCTISQVTCPASLSVVFAADLVRKKKKTKYDRRSCPMSRRRSLTLEQHRPGFVDPSLSVYVRL